MKSSSRSKFLAMLWNALWFKRNAPSKKHPLSLGAFERVAVMLSVTKSHKTGKWPTNHLQGHIKPSKHINKQFARWEAREHGRWQYLARDRRGFVRCSAARSPCFFV